MKVKPTIPGAVIRDPVTKQQLAAEGEEVPGTSFWHRRLLAREVELVLDEPPREVRSDQPTHLAPMAPLITRGEE